MTVRKGRVHEVRTDEARAAEQEDPLRRLRAKARAGCQTGQKGRRTEVDDVTPGSHERERSTRAKAGMNPVTSPPPES